MEDMERNTNTALTGSLFLTSSSGCTGTLSIFFDFLYITNSIFHQGKY